LRVADFDFVLPEGAIAQSPAEPRENARLLHVSEQLVDLRVSDLPSLLEPRDLLVLNDTAVLPTRFVGRRDQIVVEITLVQPEGSDAWWALARPGKRLRPGDQVRLSEDLHASIVEKDRDGRVLLRFAMSGQALIDLINPSSGGRRSTGFPGLPDGLRPAGRFRRSAHRIPAPD
jgi:S-adenosylmethionine:tRNA ribosyltransferase-isomerase